jgi:acetyl-CoA/propionyl-CoA carboxylase biotin carboxyl carrier protein
MNTRLQVEHPVTEQVLGLDLVELQVRVAAGEELPWKSQADVPQPRGHAIEARVYAEDPDRGFLPSSGRIVLLEEPADPSVRVDSGIRQGSEIGTSYDPMLAKVIAWADDRGEALGRLRAALRRTTVLGLSTNVGFLVRLLSLPEVAAGELDTRLVETSMARLARPPLPDEVPAAASLLEQPGAVPGDPWGTSDGWRLTGPASRRFVWRIGSDTVEVEHLGDDGLRVGERLYDRGRAWPTAAQRLAVDLDGRVREFAWAADGENLWVAGEGDTWKLTIEETVAIRGGATAAVGGSITSPMPGLVLAVHAKPGDPIEAGRPLVVVEAMKMEHVVTAPRAGTVSDVLVHEGDSVKLDQPLIVLQPIAGELDEEVRKE